MSRETQVEAELVKAGPEARERTTARLPLSQRHRRKTPGQKRYAGFMLALWMHLLILAPPYLSQRYLGWPHLNALTWSGLVEWLYILPTWYWLQKHGQEDRAIGLLMNAIGVFVVYAFLEIVGWATA